MVEPTRLDQILSVAWAAISEKALFFVHFFGPAKKGPPPAQGMEVG